jgi:carbon-monoxide dehydrogenase large subunit
VPHPFRTQLAARMRLNEAQVTVICPDIGGAFGQKIALYREELTVAALARELRRPVRWREDRAENLIAASHAREDVARTRAAVDGDGRILGLELEIVEDFGAYCFYRGQYPQRLCTAGVPGAALRRFSFGPLRHGRYRGRAYPGGAGRALADGSAGAQESR